ncbi:MAG: transporter substrate-binding domain-containing protein [Burkholderiales bacterium]|nr:transporter substrate-binding domain-containing protein [Burkholderiales bacterium]
MHAAAAPKDITVLADVHYPPFVFKDANGELTGLTVDLWRLWEKKTGSTVHIVAMDWAEAQRVFDSGKGDVIDTIFQTPEREKYLKFSAPYADVPVPIYADQGIGGVTDIGTLQGFLVGVKAGDACGETLRNAKVLVDERYDSYDAMVEEAAQSRLRVFCMDGPPGDYLLYKAGIDQRFHKAFVLYTGQFHRAYRVANPELLKRVEAGFADISEAEMEALRTKWMGAQINYRPWLRYAWWGGLTLSVLTVGMLLWGFTLRRMVRQRTAALQDERRFLRVLINTLPDLVWLKDLKGYYSLCNARFEQFFGAPEAQIVGKQDQDFLPAEVVENFRLSDEEALSAQGPVVSDRRLTYASDGHVEHVETIKTPMRDAKGRIIGILGIARDVSQHRDNEQRIDRLNRLYQVLLQVSEVVTQKADARTLYQAVCDIVVRHSGVKLAWAGEPDAEGARILPLCWAGEHPEYAQTLTLPLGGEPESRGPTSRAYHLGLPQYCDNIELDASMAPWRAQALAAGFRSLVSLPVKVNGRVRAVCNLYTPTEAFFDEQIRELVERLAVTVGMAIEAREAAQAQAEAQTRLAQSEARFSQMFLTSPIGMLLCRLDDQVVVDVNESWLRMIGRDRQDIVGRHVDELQIWDSDAVHARLEAVQRLKWGEDIDRLETRMATHHGDMRDVVWSATRINLANDLFQLESFVDITLQKQAAKNLAYHNERLESAVSLRTAELNSLFQALPDQYYRLGLDGTILDHRAGVGQRVTLLPLKRGMKLQQGLPPEGAERLTQALGQVLQKDSVVIEYELPAARGNGAVQVYEARLLPLAEREAIAVIRDVTEQRELDQAREAAREEAERLARVKSEFLANMSHEIRTPLNGVLGLAQLGYLESAGQPTQKTFETILDSGRLLLGVLNDILDISKLEAGQLTIECQPVSLRSLLNETSAMVVSRAQAKGLALSVMVEPGTPETIEGDALRIEQVLLNLLSNGVKFTEKGSVELSARSVGAGVILAVSDTGIGMAPDELNLVFAPFKQADSSTTRRYGGTGLGLSISKRLVELMGGRIEASSRPGVGSRFEVYLPLRGATGVLHQPRVSQSIKPSVSRERPQPSLAGVRVLAAEDSEVNQIVLRELLTMEGAEFTMVRDGREAVDTVESRGGGAFDVVLMDVQMPVMDGYEAARRILLVDSTLPVIGLTAHAFGDALAACNAAGMVAHVSKPYDLRKLVTTMVEHMRRRSG